MFIQILQEAGVRVSNLRFPDSSSTVLDIWVLFRGPVRPGILLFVASLIFHKKTIIAMGSLGSVFASRYIKWKPKESWVGFDFKQTIYSESLAISHPVNVLFLKYKKLIYRHDMKQTAFHYRKKRYSYTWKCKAVGTNFVENGGILWYKVQYLSCKFYENVGSHHSKGMDYCAYYIIVFSADINILHVHLN